MGNYPRENFYNKFQIDSYYWIENTGAKLDVTVFLAIFIEKHQNLIVVYLI